MTRLTPRVLALVSFLLAACSGATVTIPGSPGDGSDAGTGNDGSPTPPLPGCTVAKEQATRACLPGTAQAGATINVNMTSEGCLGCGTSNARCEVQVAGNSITLSMRADSCPVTGPCTAACMQPRVTCAIPPLAAGTYEVKLETVNMPTVTRELVVAPTGATSCTVDPNVKPMDPSAYARSCTEVSDCALVTTDTCGTCACQNAAIAKSELPRWESEQRQRWSSCEWLAGGVACKCASSTLACVNNQCVAK
jgi:hypothetical protein